jgi:predicted small lipoprotein YifL
VTLRLTAAVLALLALAACGKVGPPSAPGPPDQINYPKLYPPK